MGINQLFGNAATTIMVLQLHNAGGLVNLDCFPKMDFINGKLFPAK